MTATKDVFFKPGKVSAREKAETTDHTARAIIDAESVARDKKTERLKQARLAKEADETVQDAPKPAKARKAASKK
jgi:anti-sigma factor RsiW